MNKKIIISIIAVIILIGLCMGSYFAYQHMEENKTTGTEWGDTYYAYLKSATTEKNKEEYGLKDGMENTKIQFIEVGETNPIMTMTYDFEGNSYVNIYTTKGENQVNKIVYQDPATIEFLYDIENKSYDWYLHTENETEDSYKKVYTILENPEQNNQAEHTIAKGDNTTQDTVLGETITLSKFDETFIIPEIESNIKIDFTENIDIKALKNDITNSVENYKKQEELITEEVKRAIESKIAEIEEIKQQIETAKTEIAKKEEEEKAKAEEEARKKAEEEAAKKANEGFTLGNYKYKYGTYKHRARGNYTGIEITIKADGTYTYKNGSTTKSGTYKFIEGFDGEAIQFEGINDIQNYYYPNYYYGGTQLTEEQSNEQLVFEH